MNDIVIVGASIISITDCSVGAVGENNSIVSIAGTLVLSPNITTGASVATIPGQDGVLVTQASFSPIAGSGIESINGDVSSVAIACIFTRALSTNVPRIPVAALTIALAHIDISCGVCVVDKPIEIGPNDTLVEGAGFSIETRANQDAASVAVAAEGVIVSSAFTGASLGEGAGQIQHTANDSKVLVAIDSSVADIFVVAAPLPNVSRIAIAIVIIRAKHVVVGGVFPKSVGTKTGFRDIVWPTALERWRSHKRTIGGIATLRRFSVE